VANTKTVYLKTTGAEIEVDESPLEPGVWLIPPKCVDEEPPSFDASKKTCKYIDEEWVVADIIPKETQREKEIRLGTTTPAADQMRGQRNFYLKETDWWGASDNTMTADQTAYRKDLRDLPATASPTLDSDGKLTGVTWPTNPDE
jgi:hypothetical protein